MTKTEREIYLKAIDFYGDVFQAVKTIEEMAEFTQQLSKYIIKKGKPEKLLEEYVDVMIMLEQLAVIFDWDEKTILAQKRVKMTRLQRRVDNGHKNYLAGS